METNFLEISKSFKTKEIEIRIKVADNPQNIKKLSDALEIIDKGKMLDINIKQHRKKRSLDANGYMWILADEIAKAIGNTKEFVYQQAIKEVGQFEIMPLKNEAVDRWIAVWKSKGIGWHSEIIGDSKLEGYTNTINYYGSSVYNEKEMSILLEEIVFQATELGIETITPREKEELIRKWEAK